MLFCLVVSVVYLQFRQLLRVRAHKFISMFAIRGEKNEKILKNQTACNIMPR